MQMLRDSRRLDVVRIEQLARMPLGMQGFRRRILRLHTPAGARLCSDNDSLRGVNTAPEEKYGRMTCAERLPW